MNKNNSTLSPGKLPALPNDASKLTKWLTISLYVSILTNAACAIFGLYEYQLLTDFKNGAYAAEDVILAAINSSDNRQLIMALVRMITYLIVLFLFMRFVYRASQNIWRSGVQGLKYSSGWAVGWFFVPGANLVRPYQVMQEIWKVSKNPRCWNQEPIDSVLSWWWYSFIGSAILNRVSIQLSKRAENVDEFITASLCASGVSIVYILFSYLTVIVVTRIHRMQKLSFRAASGTLS